MERIFGLVDKYCFQGHTHIPGVFTEELSFFSPAEIEFQYTLADQKVLVNVGSVGQPRDGDTRSCYVTLNSRNGDDSGQSASGSEATFHRSDVSPRDDEPPTSGKGPNGQNNGNNFSGGVKPGTGSVLTYRRVEYDFEKTAEKIYAIPELDNFLGDRLRDGR